MHKILLFLLHKVRQHTKCRLMTNAVLLPSRKKTTVILQRKGGEIHKKKWMDVGSLLDGDVDYGSIVALPGFSLWQWWHGVVHWPPLKKNYPSIHPSWLCLNNTLRFPSSLLSTQVGKSGMKRVRRKGFKRRSEKYPFLGQKYIHPLNKDWVNVAKSLGNLVILGYQPNNSSFCRILAFQQCLPIMRWMQ